MHTKNGRRRNKNRRARKLFFLIIYAMDLLSMSDIRVPDADFIVVAIICFCFYSKVPHRLHTRVAAADPTLQELGRDDPTPEKSWSAAATLVEYLPPCIHCIRKVNVITFQDKYCPLTPATVFNLKNICSKRWLGVGSAKSHEPGVGSGLS